MTSEQPGKGSVPVSGPSSCCVSHGNATGVARSLWGWSPPPLPATGPWAGRVDRYLPRTGLPFVYFVAVIIALLNLAPMLSERADLALEAVTFLAMGCWCALNFWRCRHAHCVISGVGWLGLGAFTAAEAAIGRSLIGGLEQVAFAGLLAVALAFEAVWYMRRGTNRLAAAPGA